MGAPPPTPPLLPEGPPPVPPEGGAGISCRRPTVFDMIMMTKGVAGARLLDFDKHDSYAMPESVIGTSGGPVVVVSTRRWSAPRDPLRLNKGDWAKLVSLEVKPS